MSTIRDVAKAAGVSATTVSRILNGQGRFSEETIQRVHKVMKELHYQPNQVARTLGSKRSHTFALILPMAELPVFGLYAAAVEKAAYKRKYRILLNSSFLNTDKERDSIELLKKNMVDGIIYGGFNYDLSNFELDDIPVVTIGRKIADRIPVARADNKMIGRLAMRHLVGRGCRKIIYISGYPGGIDADERYQGIREIVKQSGKECYPYFISLDMQIDSTGQSVIYQALLDHPDADGIIAESDLISMTAIQVCAGLGIDVPEKIKIIGYGDHFYSRLTNPALTTIKEPIEAISEAAVSMLDGMIGGNPEDDKVFPVTLVQRNTT